MNFLFDCAHNLSLDAPSWRFLRRHGLLLFVLFKALSMYCNSPINQPLWYSCVSTSREREREREEERQREGDRARGNRFSRPGQAVGKEGSCRGKAEMSQDIPLWLHRAGQIQTFLQLFCVLRLGLKSILWTECKHQHLCMPTDTGLKLCLKLNNGFYIVMLILSDVWTPPLICNIIFSLYTMMPSWTGKRNEQKLRGTGKYASHTPIYK